MQVSNIQLGDRVKIQKLFSQVINKGYNIENAIIDEALQNINIYNGKMDTFCIDMEYIIIYQLFSDMWMYHD